MLKKTITYEDFDGEQVTGDFYFNLTKAEIIEVEASYSNGLMAKLEELTETEDGAGMLQLLKDLISRSYGEKRDGRFVKNPEITSSFMSSEAYSELLLSMASDVHIATAFFNGIMPRSLLEQAQAIQKKAESPVAAPVTPLPEPDISSAATPKPESRDISAMSVEELRAELERRAKEA
jgi:hypothetical protein